MTNNKINKEPLVSIIIPTYKRAPMLKRAINSVLKQSYSNVEIIVVDDNNPDTAFRAETESIMTAFESNPKLKYIKHRENSNGSAARNTGIENSKGNYVGFLDDDNYFFKDKLFKQVTYLQMNPQYKAVYCGFEQKNKTKIPNQTGNLIYEQLSGENIIDTNTILMEKKIIENFDGWDVRLKRNQDVAFMIRYFETTNEIGVISEALVYYDLADRSNEANPKENEKNTELFLKYYNSSLEKLKETNPGVEKKVYAFRYRAIFFNYIKNIKILDAARVFFKMMNFAPCEFLKLLFKRMNK